MFLIIDDNCFICHCHLICIILYHFFVLALCEFFCFEFRILTLLVACGVVDHVASHGLASVAWVCELTGVAWRGLS